MEKKYCEFMDEITSEELYEGLLSYGLFAEKIPPAFTSGPFFDYCESRTSPFSSGWNEYITFRVMRNINIPRLMGLPTPMKYQRLCSVLRDNWDKIKEHFHRQTDSQNYRVSRIHIRKEYGEKRIFDMTYKNWRIDGNPESDLLINDKGASRFLVKADISTCFPSIYTHSIPWAIAGKEIAKQTLGGAVWYNLIDKACSDMRNGETHGLLIGPHASNLLAEIILTSVDKELYDNGYRYFRNIDDYDCYVGSYDEAQLFLKDLEEALRKYDLPLNYKKTKIIELPVDIEKNWKHQLSDIPTAGNSGLIEYPQVNMFIDTALKLAGENGDYAIINYAIKKLSGLELSENGKALAAKRFMHMAVLHPYLLYLMEEYVFQTYEVEAGKIKELSDAVLCDAKKINDYESLCYAIYFAIRYGFELEEFSNKYDDSIQYVINSKDCLLLTFTWMYFMKLNYWNREASQVKPLNKVARELKNKDKDMDRYWLFCYEALSYGSLAGEWREMKQAGISFIREDLMNNVASS